MDLSQQMRTDYMNPMLTSGLLMTTASHQSVGAAFEQQHQSSQVGARLGSQTDFLQSSHAGLPLIQGHGATNQAAPSMHQINEE